MSKRGATRPWKVTYKWEDTGVTGTASYTTRDAAQFNADKIRRSAQGQDRTATVAVVDGRPLAEQHADLMAACATFVRVPGLNGRRSPLYPGKVIATQTSGTWPPYAVYADGARLVDFEYAYTFEGAVAMILSGAV